MLYIRRGVSAPWNRRQLVVKQKYTYRTVPQLAPLAKRSLCEFVLHLPFLLLGQTNGSSSSIRLLLLAHVASVIGTGSWPLGFLPFLDWHRL
jgi:hypothetical protein